MRLNTPIQTEAEHAAALAELKRLWGANPGTEAADRFDLLLVLVP